MKLSIPVLFYSCQIFIKCLLAVIEHFSHEGLHIYDDIAETEQSADHLAQVLDELVEQSVALVGKPVALMNKDDKIKAIRFLNESGAFLVTKSGDKVAKYFGISKYTLYSYIDANKQQEEKKHG